MDAGMEFTLIVIAICSYFAVRVWVKARQKEREAFYHAEAIKKIAEMQGDVPESVLSMLRAAVQPWARSSGSIDLAFDPRGAYRKEVLRSLAATPDGTEAIREFLREEDTREIRQWVGFLTLGGLVTVGAGIGLLIFLLFYDQTEPFYLVGLIPILVGAAMLTYLRIASSHKEG